MNNYQPNWRTAIAVTALLAVFFFAQWLDGPSEPQSQEDTAAAFRDALAQQQAERPDLWNAAQKKRGDVAAGIVAKEYGHE